MARKDFESVLISKQFLKRLDRFLQTKTARQLGMKSRPDFFMKIGIAFLSKHDLLYKELEKLMDISDEDAQNVDLT